MDWKSLIPRKELPPRQRELEYLFNKYPDHPREAIIKADCLNKGIGFTEEALVKLEPSRKKAQLVSISGDMATIAETKLREHWRAPEDLRIERGMYGLRSTWFEVHINPKSPYVVDVIDGELMLCANGAPLAPAESPPSPKYYSKTFDDGVPYWEIMGISGGCVNAFVSCLRNCQYWGDKEECKFCDINPNIAQQLESGRHFTVVKPLDRVATVAKAMAEEADSEPERLPVLAIVVSGGTVNKEMRGLNDEEFYVQYVRTIIEAIGNKRLLYVQTAAKDKEACKRLREAGVNVHSANFEVWDPRMFKIICPGKDKFVGRDQWIRRLVESVDVFGIGNVVSTFVEGVEMAQPWGFKDIDSAVKSTAEGFDYLMRHGVHPKPVTWHIPPLSYIGRNTPDHPFLPLEYFVKLERAWFETWKKYALPAPHALSAMGPGISRNNGGAFLEVMY